MSCLFDSLSVFVNIDSYTLRQVISNYLETNPILMDDLNAESVILYETNMSLSDYVSKMKNQDTMGGAIEIRSFINLFKVNILVKSLPNNKEIQFLYSPESIWKAIIWTGGHFDPIRN